MVRDCLGRDAAIFLRRPLPGSLLSTAPSHLVEPGRYSLVWPCLYRSILAWLEGMLWVRQLLLRLSIVAVSGQLKPALLRMYV